MRPIWSYLLLLLNQNPSGLILTLSSVCNTRAECARFPSSVSPGDDILLFILPHLIKIKACGASNAIRIVLKIWKGSPDGKWLSEAVWGDQRRTRTIFQGLFRGTLSFTGQKTTVNHSNQSFLYSDLFACLFWVIIMPYSCHQLLFSQCEIWNCDQTSQNQSQKSCFSSGTCQHWLWGRQSLMLCF